MRPDFYSARRRYHLLRGLLNLPDRWSLPRWRERLRLAGRDNLETACATGRPVVLVTLHFGALLILRPALRSLGFPVATLVTGKVEDRNRLRQLKDRLCPPLETPSVLSGRFPKGALRFLKQGGLMIGMLDHEEGVLLEVPVPGGTWRVSSTPLRLARQAGAIVMPVLTWEEGPWRFVIHAGRPVPDDLLQAPEQYPEALQFLWKEFLPVLQQAPYEGFAELNGSLRIAGT